MDAAAACQPRLPPRVGAHFTPAVAAFGGIVHVTYLTASAAPGVHSAAAEHYAASTDAGKEFRGHRVLSRLDLRYAAAADTARTNFLGDYQAIAAWGNRANAV